MHDGERQSDRGENLLTLPVVTGVVPVPRLELVITSEAGQSRERSLTLEGERVRIGSHESNEVVLEDRAVSRFHCSLVAGPRGWTVTDSGSLNGTYLGGVRVRDADLPSPQCVLRLGGSTLTVRELGASSLARLPEWSRFGDLHGESLAMRRIYAVLERVAPTDATVLIEGESGTGKELVAHELVRRGPRAGAPWITVDTGAISPSLIESELFGHARGAFTGADRERKGAFESAHGGTLLLDEIGEMPLDLQPKLLRALEARELRREGETQPRRIDVRVIAATNRNLEREVNRGRFRGDLYFRLSVLTLRLPPLRERLDDLPLLVRALLESMGASDQAHLFPPRVLRDLAEHDWPGNVRELRNYVERAVILGATGAVGRGSEPFLGEAEASNLGVWNERDLDQPFKVAKERLVTQFEKAYLARLLEICEGNVSRAARAAKLDRMYLHRLLQRHGLREKVNGD
jgi:DNA-binding NtrC family response regulator